MRRRRRPISDPMFRHPFLPPDGAGRLPRVALEAALFFGGDPRRLRRRTGGASLLPAVFILAAGLAGREVSLPVYY
jgi:hypothetical protein